MKPLCFGRSQTRSRARAVRDLVLIMCLLGSSLVFGCGQTRLDSLGPSEVSRYLIDDLEDGDELVPNLGKRRGRWYVFSDEFPSTDVLPRAPLPPVRAIQLGAGRRFAAYIRGANVQSYAGLGVGVAGEDLTTPYNVEDFSGVRFRARLETELGDNSVRVDFVTTETGSLDGCVMADAGETATQPSAVTSACNNHFGIELVLGTDWADYTIRFAELSEKKSSAPSFRRFQRALFRDVQFLFGRNNDFELWVDEMRFIE